MRVGILEFHDLRFPVSANMSAIAQQLQIKHIIKSLPNCSELFLNRICSVFIAF